MDLVYIPDVVSFGSYRSPHHRDYEQPWNKNYFEDGTKATPYLHHRQIKPQQRVPSKKNSCDLCKENKRRSLAAYIRGKTRNNSCHEICEEVEEAEEAEETTEQQQQQQENKSDCKDKK